MCGITITDSSDVTVEDVSLYHCGGMGVIGQRSHDLFVRRVKVTPPPGKNRIVSITADATHFVNCGGKVVLEDCLFELQKDDATNVHGIYVRIVNRVAPAIVDVKLVHPQQYGFDFIRKGQKLELVKGPALTTYAYPVVKQVERLNKEYTRLTFKEPLPDTVAIGDALAAIDDYAALAIRGCTIRGNRARGILLNRDECRSPMQWDAGPNAGFTPPTVACPKVRIRTLVMTMVDKTTTVAPKLRDRSLRRAEWNNIDGLQKNPL